MRPGTIAAKAPNREKTDRDRNSGKSIGDATEREFTICNTFLAPNREVDANVNQSFTTNGSVWPTSSRHQGEIHILMTCYINTSSPTPG
mgnify:CR=1 FL=1